jgi:hypothetical protein
MITSAPWALRGSSTGSLQAAAGKGRAERIFGRRRLARAGDHSDGHLHAGIAGLGRNAGAGAAGKQDGIELVAVQIGIEPVSTITHIDGASATSFDGWC